MLIHLVIPTTTQSSLLARTGNPKCKYFAKKQAKKKLNIETSLFGPNRKKIDSSDYFRKFDFNTLMSYYGRSNSSQISASNLIDFYYYTIINGCIIPLGVEAIIIPSTNKISPPDYGKKFDEEMACLNANGFGDVPYKHLRPKDEKGQLISSKFGGLADEYNIVPQHVLLKKEGDWIQKEANIEQFLKNQSKNPNSCPGVKYKVVVNYRSLKYLRPVGFKVEIDYYNDINKNERSSNETAYFSNEVVVL